MEDDTVSISKTVFDEMNWLLEQAPRWVDRGQATTVLTSITVIEELLEAALMARMMPLTKKLRARLFDGYGPLNTLAAKADVAYAFHILSERDYDDMQIIRKIRNEFAHSREPLGFEVKRIEQMVSRLSKPKATCESAYQSYFARAFEIGRAMLASAERDTKRAARGAKVQRKKKR
ncbi:MAG: hypothetical protein QOI05_4294 [Bradyrhizobium sp.]|jgi:DNA-binding MltR family transcriptional regulator|nr:hypothetical protein [Bradyrhizobium sp.]